MPTRKSAGRSIIRLCYISSPQSFPAPEDGEIYAETWKLSDAMWWAKRAKFEGYFCIIAATSLRCPDGTRGGGARRGFTVFIKRAAGVAAAGGGA